MQPTCHGDGAADDPPLSSTASQEAWDLEIIGSVFLGLFGFRMWLGHRWRDGDGRCHALLDRGRLALVHRPFETTDRASLLDRGRDDRDLDLATHPFVDHRAEDDVRLRVRRRVDDLRSLVHFEEGQIGAAGDGEEDAARTIDRLLEEGRHDRLTRRVRGARLARPVPDTHERRSGIRHDRLHVREVEVDKTRHRDEVADALNALSQHVIDDAERVDHARLLLDDLEQAIVWDGDERVDLVDELSDALLGEEPALRALEAERLGHDGDGQRSHVLRDLGDDRSGARARAATHASGDEHHVRFLQGLVELLAVVLGRLAPDRRVGARAKALRDLVSDAELVGSVGQEEGLRIRVHRNELDAEELGPDHSIHGVRTAAAYTDDLNEREVLDIASEGHG